MKLSKLILGFAVVFGLSMALSSCGGHSHEGGDHSHGEQTEAEAGHDHDGHDHADGDHEGHDHDGHDHGTEAAAHGESAEYTSAFVCPMHCKGSGSDEAGTCPACKMDYVAQADHVKDGHTH